MADDFITRTLSNNLTARSSGNADTDGLTLFGYGVRFNDVTHIRSWEGDFDERVAPGAFRETLTQSVPIIQWDHGHDPAVGMVPIAVVETLTEDRTGLYVEARMHDNPQTLPIRQAIASGAVQGMSFKFRVVEDYWRDRSGKLLTPRDVQDLLFRPGDRGPLQRTLTKVELFELGPVHQPAYPTTSVGLRTDTEHAELDRLNIQLLKAKL